MFAKILGWLWVITGIIFFLKPHMLRNRLQKKSIKKIRKYLFALALAISAMILGAAWNSKGILAKIVFFFGIVGIFKSLFLLKAKASEKLIKWFADQSLKFFRIWAVLQIGFGIVLLFLR